MRPAPAALAAALLLPLPALAQEAFQSPSGNIQCFGGPGYVDCEILESETAPPGARPADCDLEWGQRFTVGDTGPGMLACYGDTLRGQGYAVLGYGQSVSYGAITCTSYEAGMECLNADGGGFLVSRRDQRLY